jgi:membrane associated rhomboid family serine protease
MKYITLDNNLPEKEKGTLLLIGILFTCFWLQWFLSEHFINKLYLSDYSFFQLISHQFLHVHSIHLIANLALLYIFGKAVETRLGVCILYALFLFCGICGGITHLMFSERIAAGASAAISGLIATTLVFDRKTMIYFFDWRFGIPVWILAVLWVIKDLIALFIPALRSGPAAHLGGFLAGLLCASLIMQFRKR